MNRYQRDMASEMVDKADYNNIEVLFLLSKIIKYYININE